MSPRTFLITLGFCPNKVFKHTAARLKKSLSGKHDIEKIFILKPYPLEKEKNLELNHRCALDAGYRVIERYEDLGAAGDFNKVIGELDLQDDDIVINYDSDIYPVQDAWDDAMISVLRGEPSIDWVCLWNEATQAEFIAKSGGRAVINGFRVEYAADWMMVGVSGFRGSFMKRTGGLIQPPKYYGGVESAMWHAILERNTKQAFLVDYYEDQRIKHPNEDELYRDWKTVACQRAFPFSFEQWLRMRGLV